MAVAAECEIPPSEWQAGAQCKDERVLAAETEESEKEREKERWDGSTTGFIIRIFGINWRQRQRQQQQWEWHGRRKAGGPQVGRLARSLGGSVGAPGRNANRQNDIENQ